MHKSNIQPTYTLVLTNPNMKLVAIPINSLLKRVAYNYKQSGHDRKKGLPAKGESDL